MAQAIISPLLERGENSSEKFFAVVRSLNSVQSFQENQTKWTSKIKVVSSDNSESRQAWEAPLILLAVKPQQLNMVKASLDSIKFQHTSTKPLLISILAGVSLKRLTEIFPTHNCVRVVPNTPCLVRKGLTALSWEKETNLDQVSKVKSLFNPISEVLELPESQLDSFLALTSSGPAYISLIVEALSDGAVASGLPRDLAYQLTNKMISGTLSLLEEKQMHPAELKDMVASPAGTTINAIRHLEMAGLRSALIEAVVSATETSRQLR